MLAVKAELTIQKENESIKIKTSDSGTLVLNFSNWQIFEEVFQIPKTNGLSIPEIRSKLKHLSTPLQIQVGSKNALRLEGGRVRFLSFIAFFKLLQITLFN